MSTSYLEFVASNINDMDDGLPKSRGRCFDIGIWGGCGVSCPAFIDGECGEPQEISREMIVEEHGEEESKEIMGRYACFEIDNIEVKP
jgi:hypothetical protein